MVWNVSTNGPQRQWAVDGRQHGHAEGPRLWELLLKAAHEDGSCSPKCQSLSAFPREGSNELHQLSAARAQGADAVNPGPAGWARPGRMSRPWQLLAHSHTGHLTQPHRSLLRAEWQDTHGWAGPWGSTRYCAVIPLVSASCCLWGTAANLASAFAQHSRGIPAWCWQTDPTTKRLMFYISALHAWGSPKKSSSLQQASNYHKPFQSQWQQLSKLRHRMRLPSIPRLALVLLNCEALSKSVLFSISIPPILLGRLPGGVL